MRARVGARVMARHRWSEHVRTAHLAGERILINGDATTIAPLGWLEQEEARADELGARHRAERGST